MQKIYKKYLVLAIAIILLSVSISCNSSESVETIETPAIAKAVIENTQAQTQSDVIKPDNIWRLKKLEEDGITLELPSEFEADYSLSWTTLDTKIFEMQKVDEKDLTSPKVTINLTQTGVYKIGKNSTIYAKHTPQERLPLIFKNFQVDKDAVDKDRRGEPTQYKINSIKGLLQKTDRKDGRKSIIWTTFRYFGNEIQRVWIEIYYQKTDSEKVKRILDSMRFGGKRSDLLTTN
ncbi:MAG: hypothetical protein MUC29_12870 [Pyrinomonadaceae bacterium]|jgi:hypothetical protein|nr:hypothetical protein [Pyrinomonadaceae bacterium]